MRQLSMIGTFILFALWAAAAGAGEKRIIRPEGTKPDGNYSPGILIDGTLYVSGQAGEDANGKVPDDFDAEAKLALDNVGVVLKAAEMSPSDVVSVQVYLTDAALFPRMNAVYRDYFKDPRPTRTTVVVAKLVGPGHIEITVTARKQQPMSDQPASSTVSLEATSPHELRTNLGRGVSEDVIKRSLDTGDIGFLHSFTTGSTVDGPGVRVVVWTAGCQFRCLYCHNPDTWSLSNGMPVPLERTVEQLKKYQHGLKVMSGGLTISGGEPLMQDRFVVRLFAAARQMGVHTALDTNGFLGERLSDGEVDAIDLFLLDIKSWNPERHRHVTGKDVGPVLTFARRLAAHKRPIWLRFVLVPGLTDDVEDVGQIAKFAAGLGNVQRVDVLPFHQMGRFKWKELALDYSLGDTQPPSRELVERVCRQFKSEGLTAY